MAELELEGGGLATALLATARMLRAMVEMYMIALGSIVVGVGVRSSCRVQKCLDEAVHERQHASQRPY